MSILRDAARRLAVATGVPSARLRRRRWPGVLVVSYHAIKPAPGPRMAFDGLHVTAAQFEAHCAVFARLCHPISLAEWRAHRERGGALPARPVLVTFDDGYRSVAERAVPILERYEVPAAVFLCTGPIAAGERFWYDSLAERESEAAVEALKAADYGAWRAATEHSHRAASGEDPHAPMNAETIARLARHPLIEFGAHTVTHPILARAPRDVQRAEIEGSVAAVAAWTGRPVTAFAYPNGRDGIDFDETTIDLLRAQGVTDAFSTRPAVAPLDVDRFRIPRLVAVDGWTGDALVWRLSRLPAA